jgi:competence protein ComEC
MAWYYGHKLHPFVLLPFAAAITVALNPSYVWGDLGWQLSFTAFAGVMIVAPLLQAYFFGKKEPGVLRQILGETIAAHIVTVPIIALSFGTISNVAIIANLLVVPLVPLAMLLTFICGVWSITAIPFADLIAIPTTWLLGYMVQVATFVSELEWAQSELVVPGWAWLIYTLIVGITCIWMWHATKFNFRGTDPLI